MRGSRAALHVAGQARALAPIVLDAGSASSVPRPRQLALFGT
jgi:hypothetical protein